MDTDPRDDAITTLLDAHQSWEAAHAMLLDLPTSEATDLAHALDALVRAECLRASAAREYAQAFHREFTCIADMVDDAYRHVTYDYCPFHDGGEDATSGPCTCRPAQVPAFSTAVPF